MSEPARKSESGNVFIYIFISIALLAALSFAVSQGGRSSITELTQDTRRLSASEMISYADTVAKALTQLRLRGVAADSLSFANEFLSAADYGAYNAAPANEIFNPAGGAVVYADPPTAASISGVETWQFLSHNEIENIGTTCGAAACADLVMTAPGLRQEICVELNDLLGVSNPGGVPPPDANIDETGFFQAGANPFAADAVVGDESPSLDGIAEACFAETGETPDEFIYYKVLLPR